MSLIYWTVNTYTDIDLPSSTHFYRKKSWCLLSVGAASLLSHRVAQTHCCHLEAVLRLFPDIIQTQHHRTHRVASVSFSPTAPSDKMWPRDARSSLWERWSVTAPAKELIICFILSLSQMAHAEYQSIKPRTHKSVLLWMPDPRNAH